MKKKVYLPKETEEMKRLRTMMAQCESVRDLSKGFFYIINSDSLEEVATASLSRMNNSANASDVFVMNALFSDVNAETITPNNLWRRACARYAELQGQKRGSKMKFRFVPVYQEIEIDASSKEEAIAKFNAMHECGDLRTDEAGTVFLSDDPEFRCIGSIEEEK